MKPTDITEVPDNCVSELRNLVSELRKLDSEVDRLEKLLAEAKQKHRRLQTEFIPDLMLGNGMQAVRLEDGTFLTIKKFYSAKIPDKLKEQAYAWLDKNGFGGLIKTEVKTQFIRSDRQSALQAFELLRSSGYVPQRSDNVHPQTLKSWVKEQLEGGASLPLDMFGVYIGNTTQIKQTS